MRKAAATYLKPKDFSIVVVGPSQGRTSDLSEFGPVRQLDISIAPPPAPPQGGGGPASHSSGE